MPRRHRLRDRARGRPGPPSTRDPKARARPDPGLGRGARRLRARDRSRPLSGVQEPGPGDRLLGRAHAGGVEGHHSGGTPDRWLPVSAPRSRRAGPDGRRPGHPPGRGGRRPHLRRPALRVRSLWPPAGRTGGDDRPGGGAVRAHPVGRRSQRLDRHAVPGGAGREHRHLLVRDGSAVTRRFGEGPRPARHGHRRRPARSGPGPPGGAVVRGRGAGAPDGAPGGRHARSRWLAEAYPGPTPGRGPRPPGGAGARRGRHLVGGGWRPPGDSEAAHAAGRRGESSPRRAPRRGPPGLDRGDSAAAKGGDPVLGAAGAGPQGPRVHRAGPQP